MTLRVDKDRFEVIVEAYGATPARWPEDAREAMQAFIAEHPVEAHDVLAEARGLDAMMDAVKAADHRHAEADQALFETVLAQFVPVDTVVSLRPARALSGSRRAVVWGVGFGLAACLAGAIFGVNLSLMSLSDLRVQTVLEQVAMIDGDG
jgi:hypothetical protein